MTPPRIRGGMACSASNTTSSSVILALPPHPARFRHDDKSAPGSPSSLLSGFTTHWIHSSQSHPLQQFGHHQGAQGISPKHRHEPVQRLLSSLPDVVNTHPSMPDRRDACSSQVPTLGGHHLLKPRMTRPDASVRRPDVLSVTTNSESSGPSPFKHSMDS